jgi:hypothetical protein
MNRRISSLVPILLACAASSAMGQATLQINAAQKGAAVNPQM